ncbi:hypothetical protein [Streptomyces cahuitamycinicus]|nr:hypothetical protein [Streptomyces cahuitamycinicus]
MDDGHEGQSRTPQGVALTRSLACGDGPLPSARAERMARGVFAALGGILMEGVRVVGRFSGEVMAIADALGYFQDHEVHAASLLPWSEGVAGFPDPVERLEEPEMVWRMCRVGADLQLTRLLQALVTAALAAGTEPGEGAAGIAEILRVACGLVEPGRALIIPAECHRMWRVAHLPAILRPASDAPEWGKTGYRAYDAELERVLQGKGPWPARPSV